MISLYLAKILRKINNILGEYKIRKIFSVIFMIMGIIFVTFPIIQIISFNDFEIKEIALNDKYHPKNFVVSTSEQKTLFTALSYLLITSGAIIVILSTIIFILLISQRYNGYAYFRTITWISIFSILFAFVILAIKPNNIYIRDPAVLKDPTDPTKGIVNIGSPVYMWIWIVFVGMVFTSITSGLVRQEHGGLKYDNAIKKYKIFQKANY